MINEAKKKTIDDIFAEGEKDPAVETVATQTKPAPPLPPRTQGGCGFQTLDKRSLKVRVGGLSATRSRSLRAAQTVV